MKHFFAFVGVCFLSVAIYCWLFMYVIEKPLTVGIYRDMIKVKQDYARQQTSPKLFIVAGSNGRVSHSAKTFEDVLALPTINASLTAAVSLPFTIDQFSHLLEPGDFVYMPIEYEQYAFDLEEEKTDGHYLIAYDKASFWRQDPRRVVGQLFSFDLPYLISGAGEMFMDSFGVQRRITIDNFNIHGDQVGHTVEAGALYRRTIEEWPWSGPVKDSVLSHSYTRDYLAEFLRWATENKITVVGGLPTTFNDQRIDPAIVDALRSFFVDNGHLFVDLPNQSQYPRSFFYDTPYHLLEPYQRQHSQSVAEKLRQLLRLGEDDNELLQNIE